MSTVKLKTGFFATPHPCVYENKNGGRIHTFGMLMDAQGNIFTPNEQRLQEHLILTGGNRRRALMACLEHAGAQ